MSYSDQFFNAIGISGERGSVERFAKLSGVPAQRLKFYNHNNVLPSGSDLDRVIKGAGITELLLKLKMGRVDKSISDAIQFYADEISELLARYNPEAESPKTECKLEFETSLGKLYRGDCIRFLKSIDNDSIDLVFADPPFNLSKLYPSEIDDRLKTENYLHWCQEWLFECARVIKPGGALFLWNLPKWNSSLSSYIESFLTFRNWIGVDIKYSLPISNRLYPSHYSLLYFIKGERPNTFNPDRLPMQVCPKCYGDLKDYGGYKDKMNPAGVNMSDIWLDIPPVRHAKYKRRDGSNELSLKLLDRIIQMATKEGDVVLDPFGGAGTTYMAAELKGRRWLGCEIGPIDVIVERFNLIEKEREIIDSYRKNLNSLFPENIKHNREKLGLWTCETVRNPA
ncbi:BamHI-like site-specific methyltransferase [Hahella chejuensis KCTC 2396]|uniref:site-specific DNA-methyltransferase (adenine-specific) n=1 Tax=Hahella chejuensis (strain KCTC 2396) TaxID=349521 RepID=Q2SJ82_HAHCH|nr:site-specific DNA-methyltransferase [Hahella chejuensis]ABC29292.1 BamHI-like site-specific methyltransferase [Hahella chejuensis KCTC 2396]